MAILKCKMCGGTIEFSQGATVGVCDSCGTRQTLPRLNDDRRANLYERANHFRRNNEFDKAEGLYEQILNEDITDAEAYWSLVLCRYGIEYVEDPATHRRVPTVNRAQFNSIFGDDNYRSALQYADDEQRAIYQAEANAINEIQKGILAISQKEEPFDVFICYKESDQNGGRTQDSVLAYDLYRQLTQEGLRVFFARVTLEDKLGIAYEPYIFAALNSAKVMVVLGTKPEHFNAVWVKNEWRRFLSLVMQSGGEKMLIPAYMDMSPYDLPDEFAHLQAQDMSKLGWMQDLTRGIVKILRKPDASKAVVANVQETQTSVTYKKEVSEKIKRQNGEPMISRLQVMGTNEDNPFSNGQPSLQIDIYLYKYLSMQMYLRRRIGYTGTAVFNFSVFDSNNDWITNLTSEINVLPQYDRLGKNLILRGNDGSRMEPGRYRIEAWINESQVAEMYFELIDTTEARNNRRMMLENERAALYAELSDLKGLFTGKRKKEIQARIAQIEYEMRYL